MPIVTTKEVQQGLKKNQIYPVYWIYGSEAMKARELLRQIRTQLGADSNHFYSLDGKETTVDQILDIAQSYSLLPGAQLVVVRDAQLVEGLEALKDLTGPAEKMGPSSTVCVLMSPDWDKRRKSIKILSEKAAMVPCEEILEADRSAWIEYLAKRRSLALTGELQQRLVSLDPWSLDRVDQELEKSQLGYEAEDLPLEGFSVDQFVSAFLERNYNTCLSQCHRFANDPEITLPLVGLLAWNLRQLTLLFSGHTPKGPSFVTDRLRRLAEHWSLSTCQKAQRALMDLDHAIKQTPRLPLASWSVFIQKATAP